MGQTSSPEVIYLDADNLTTENNDADYVIDTYMFGVIENDRERKSNGFSISFCYRG